MIFNTPSNICCKYLLESPHRGDSNKYLQQMVFGVNKAKASVSLPLIPLFVGFHIGENSFEWQNLREQMLSVDGHS